MGSLGYEFLVVRSDLAADQLPTSDGRVIEDDVEVVAETWVFPGGESPDLTVDLSAGSYVLICNVKPEVFPGHYGSGMFTAFTVTASAQQATPQIAPASTGNAGPAAGGGNVSASLAALLVAATIGLTAGGRVLVSQRRRPR